MDVTFYVDDAEARSVGKGLVPMVDKPEVPAGALVLFDATGMGKHGRALRKAGHPVIGGNPFDEDLEVNRTRGAAIMAAAGIRIPETHPFDKVADAVEFLGEHDGKWYMKVTGDAGTNMTYNAPDPQMMIRYLHWWDRQPGPKPAFILQREVANPIAEISCEGWFDGQKFVPPFNATIETKKFMAGDRGVRTGCEQNLVWALDGTRPPLAARGVARIERQLRSHGYVGPIDLNQIIDAAGVPHGLEWSARTGFDAFPAYCHLIGEDLYDQLDAFAHGALAAWEISDQAALTIRISTPPYPTERARAASFRGIPLDDTLLHDDRITVTDVMRGPDGKPAHAGRDGHVGTVGEVGCDLAAMRIRVLALADALVIPSKQYREDILPDVEETLRALEAHGYLSHAGLAHYLAVEEE